MEDSERDDLGRLALWLSRRRAVDDALELLTAYGPTACERVRGHLDALRALLDAERAAFTAFESSAPAVGQSPLPTLLERPSSVAATVHLIDATRDRSPG